MKFLVVDDDPIYCDLLSAWLVILEHSCDSVTNGQDALNMLSTTEYDCVISDLYMPGMSGYMLYYKISESTDIPVIVISNEFACCGNKCPMIKYRFNKPHNIESFIKLIDNVIERETKLKKA